MKRYKKTTQVIKMHNYFKMYNGLYLYLNNGTSHIFAHCIMGTAMYSATRTQEGSVKTKKHAG